MHKPRVPRWFRWMGTGVTLVLAIIGLAGVPEDVQTWGGWLRDADSDTARWGFLIVAVILMGGIWLLTSPKPSSSSALAASPNIEASSPDPATDVHTASLKVGNCPGWRAWCEHADALGVFGRGVMLHLEGPEDDDASAVVCRVFNNDAESHESGRSTFGVGDAGHSFTKHYPGEFSGASQPYRAAAPYRVAWLGSSGAFPDAVDVILAETSFEIDESNRPYFGPGSSPPPQGWPEMWHSEVRFVVPSETGSYSHMPHKIVLELHGVHGQQAEGSIKAIVQHGGASFESKVYATGQEGVRFEASNLEPGDKPHYYIFFPDGFPDAPRILDDGAYELRWMERHAMGWRLRHDPQVFEIKDGELVIP